jgi:hypothetical protein
MLLVEAPLIIGDKRSLYGGKLQQKGDSLILVGLAA